MTAPDITIPDEALEAAALEAYCKWVSLCVENGGVEEEYRTWADLDDVEREQWREHTKAACLAMLRAWPRMEFEVVNDGSEQIVLPLKSQEHE